MNQETLQTLGFLVMPLLPVLGVIVPIIIFVVGWWLPRRLYKTWELRHGYNFARALLSRLVINFGLLIFWVWNMRTPSWFMLVAFHYAIAIIVFTGIIVVVAVVERKRKINQPAL